MCVCGGEPGRKFLSISRVVSEVTSKFLQSTVIAFVNTVIVRGKNEELKAWHQMAPGRVSSIEDMGEIQSWNHSIFQ